jgi:hypothetical protein
MEVGTDYSGMGVVANQGHSDSNIILSTYSDESLQFTLSFVRRTLKRFVAIILALINMEGTGNGYQNEI